MKYIKLPENEIIELYLSNKFKMYEICQKYGVSKFKIRKILLDNNIESKSSKKYKYYDDIFSEINTKEKAYWLGFLYADGYVRLHKGRSAELRLKLGVIDKSHLIKFKKFISEDIPVVYDEYRNSKSFKISINSKKIVEDLIKNGCFNKKSKIIEFPKLNFNLYSHFIRGFFDGDGCIFYSEDSIYMSLVSGSISFLESVSNFLEKYCKCKKANLTGNSIEYKYIIYSAKDDIKKLYEYIYLDADCFLERKKNKFKFIIENYDHLLSLINKKRRSKRIKINFEI